ncbi:epimerase family protein SDR39U1 isoform X4 [Emydura macquarii macquarii]|uniref:epimerase family protein SDR39U1 isoform X4 n=1 Tax=Emydura macquarii macquarii TaxID=1129001 RepID=UPI00352A1AD6
MRVAGLGGHHPAHARSQPRPARAMRVLVGGGTGFVGGALTQLLRSRGHEVTHVSRHQGPGRISWDKLSRSGLPPCDAAVNLAGGMRPSARWWLPAGWRPPRPWPRPSLRPSSHPASGSSSPALLPPQPHGRVHRGESRRRLRLLLAPGVVLGKGGGAVSQMLWPFRLGLGGPVGSGQQPFPWVHVRDAAGLVCHALETEAVDGVLNGVSPASPATSNADFARELGRALGRPALLPLPGWGVRAVFGAERAIMLLEGQRVVPRWALASGYRFVYHDLPSALREVVS